MVIDSTGVLNRPCAGKPAPPSRAKRLKVLHVGKFYPPHRGGIENHLEALCKQLHRDVDVEVLVSNRSRTTEEEVLDGIPVTRLATAGTLARTSINPGLIAGIRQSNADIIHIHWPNPAATLAHLLSRHPARLVITYHSDVVRQRLLGALFSPFLEASLKRSDAIIAASPDYVESSPHLRNHKDRCQVIPYGIPDDCFRPRNESAVAALRQKFGEPLVFSVGRLVYYKGFDQLIRAMQWAPGRLLIAGDGPLRGELVLLAEKLGLADRVEFVGNPSNEELHQLYHAADVFVLASVARSEAFGIVQAEAMATGKPVVNTRLASGVPFVSQHGRTGLTVPPSDPEALGQAIRLLLEDHSLRTNFGRAARHRAETVFRASTMTADTLSLYEEVMAGVRSTQRTRSR